MITKLTKDLNHVQGLSNLPNADDGLTPEQLKAKFDQAGNEIKDYLNNTLTPEIDSTFATKAENSLKANKVDVYTKTELQPYLAGGDTKIKYEVFTIVTSNNGDGTFTYKDSNNNSIVGDLDESGNQVFALQNGSYQVGQNRIEAFINDTLHRSQASGGLEEVSSTAVKLTVPAGDGAEITFRYFERIGLAGEHGITHEIGGSDELKGLVHVSATPPTNPYLNKVWIDIS